MAVTPADKKNRLVEIIGRESCVAVACSGGVDSTLLVKLCCDVLGPENVIAVFAETLLLPSGEGRSARETVRLIGCLWHVVRLDPLSWHEFTANPPERCYLCKKRIFHVLLSEVAGKGFHVLWDGTNLDDLSDYRPGLKALEELDIKSPLSAAGLTKKDVRRLSRDLGLPTWNKYSSSCLATRIATGQEITMDTIALIKRCEEFLIWSGFPGCRVRIKGQSATIEVLEEDITRFGRMGTIRQIVEKFNNFGVDKVFLDLSGRKGIVL